MLSSELALEFDFKKYALEDKLSQDGFELFVVVLTFMIAFMIFIMRS